MKKITFNTSKNYDIIIKNNILEQAGIYIRNISSSKNVLIISDSNVAPLYINTLSENLKKQNFKVSTFVFKAGENSKNFSTIEKIYNKLFTEHITRSDLIVSLGGGVPGDISGFVASTYLRGINYVQIPTSLLAQIDSSIGGKTGVNSEYGKNLIGTFWQPSLVIIDPQLLLTLPKSQFQNGMAEAIKYGCIKNIDLLYRINNEQPKDFISDLIFECVKIKKDIVCKDEYDKEYRMILNFGHTIGHAIEKLYKYENICHGQAISIGMCIVTNISERIGITKKYTYNYLRDTLKKYSLPTHDNSHINTISENIIYDKKLCGNILNLILIKEFGTPYIYKISSNKIKNFLKEYKYE